MSEFERLQNSVLSWAHERGILNQSDAKTQCLKTVSELGELADNIAKGRHTEARDDIGDTLVTLILLSELINTNLTECLAIAYDEIRTRQGRMVNGIFVKDAP